jgi:acyl-CoA hydrolase
MAGPEDEEPPEEPKGELALRTLAMPADTNPAGDIFGGWLMGQMDIAGGMVAGMRARGRVATAFSSTSPCMSATCSAATAISCMWAPRR